MSNNTVQRIAMWTPMPPSRSGIADYSAELLGPLQRRCDIEVFTDPMSALAYEQDESRAVFPFAAFEERNAYVAFDLNVYHMGNSREHHETIYERLLQQPGIIVLHDATLFDFYWAFLVTLARGEEFLDEVEYNFGPETRALMPLYFQDKLTVDRLDFHLARRTVEAGLALIVHNEWSRDRFSRLYPQTDVIHIPMGTPILGPTEGQDLRARYSWGADALVIGVFGGLSRAKRIDVVVDAFIQVHRDHPETRLLLAGRVDDPPYAQQIRESVHDAGLDDVVSIVHELPFNAFERHLTAVDLVVNLRQPTAGETSATLIRALGAGKVVIASDVPQVREWDPQFCWLVPTKGKEETRRLAGYLAHAATHRNDVLRAGDAARAMMRECCTWDMVAAQYGAVFDAVLAEYTPQRETRPDRIQHRASGLNVMADLTVATGVGEAANSTIGAIIAQGIPTSYIELKAIAYRQPFGIKPRSFRSLPHGSLHPVNLLLHNINEMYTIEPQQWSELKANKYTIASWFYELPRIPDSWLDALEQVDEIWAPSEYTRSSMLTVAHVPVRVIPVPVDVRTSPTPDRSTFSIPHDRYVFYCSFSATSCSSRKNPWGVIEAFDRAFGSANQTGPLLVMKVHHLDRYPVLQEALRASMRRLGGILIERSFSRQQTNDLLFCADSYVSLHRSEGFGLGMAESMYLGKPVIGTYHSGNVDFMTEKNSFLVRCTLRPISLDDHRYQPECSKVYEPGQEWAEPDLEQAAAHMYHVYTHGDEARGVGQHAARDIRAYCSPRAVGQAIEARLVQLGAFRTVETRGEEVGAHVNRV